MKYFKKLIGKNIYLSPMNEEDVEQYVTWLSDVDVTKGLGNHQKLTTLAGEKRYLQNQTEIGYNFSIVSLKEDRLFGNCSLMDLDFINQTATLGIFIGNEQDRGLGYGMEAITLLLEYGFHELNLENIMLSVYNFNDQAIRCYEKCGFHIFGTRRNCYYFHGKKYNRLYMEILKEEFEKKAISL